MKSYYAEDYQAYLRYHDIPGEKLPVIFIHGIGCSASSDYPAIAASPSLQGHHCILVDQFGAGFSDHPDNFLYTVEAHAKVLASLITALDLSRFVIFGHSAGGAIATMLATLCEDKVAALILSEPNLDAGGGFFSQSIAAQSLTDYITHGHQDKIRQSCAEGNAIWAGTMQVAAPRAVHQLAGSLITGATPSWRELLIRLSKPRLVMFGEHSLPDKDVDELPHSGVKTVVIPGVGHSMMWENPQMIARVIAKFTAEI